MRTVAIVLIASLGILFCLALIAGNIRSKGWRG